MARMYDCRTGGLRFNALTVCTQTFVVVGDLLTASVFERALKDGGSVLLNAQNKAKINTTIFNRFDRWSHIFPERVMIGCSSYIIYTSTNLP